MRILIIEDEHKIANALKRGLEHETFAIDVAYDSDEGLGYATTQTYDAIILDRMLPGEFDGLAICEQLRAQKNHTPIIMLTAKDQIADRVAGLNAGADDYLVKPFAFEELLARLHALMRRPENVHDTTLQVNDLSLNPTTFEVKRADQLISLSRKEFSLLQFLMRNAGIVVSKDTIISHVWNFDADILPNTVEVYMGYLRQKVDKPFPSSPDLIQTVRGFGYRLGSTT